MWAIISLLNFALCIYIYYSMVKKVTKLTITSSLIDEENRPTQLPRETALWFLDIYIKVFKTQNLASIGSIMSDYMLRKVQMEVQTLNKLGLRRDITVDPYPPNPDTAAAGATIGGGKSQSAATTIQGDYVEQYVDSTTGSTLYEYRKKHANINLGITRSALRTSKEAGVTYCLNCGGEVQTGGEVFVCRHCGTTYRSDSYDWVVHGVQFDFLNEISDSPTMKGLKIYGQILVPSILISVLLGIFAGGRPVITALVLLINITYLLFTFWACKTALGLYVGMFKMREFDPLMSDATLGGRIDYLLRRAYYAHDFEPQDIRTMMAPEAYQQWLSGHSHSGNYVVDVRGGHLIGKTDFFVRDGRQYFNCEFECTLLTLSAQRQIITVPKRFQISFYRNEGTRYTHMLEAQVATCTGCGNSLDITTNGTCKYCGIEYEIADFDWKIAHISPEAFV